MKICVIGTGYVGLVTGACFAEVGNDVICVDKNSVKIEALHLGKISFFEPNLDALTLKNVKEGRLRFTKDLAVGLMEAQTCFICVDTPLDGDGNANIANVISVAQETGQTLEKPLIVVTKSTVPVGTTLQVKKIITEALLSRAKPPDWIKVASNPEFLKEGDAVHDFMRPNRIVVGTDSKEVAGVLHTLYAPFMLKQDRFIVMDIQSAELTKYACNAMLATRISFVNDLARLAEKIGADIKKIREAMGRDPRIGPGFLYAGLGYGGSCLPKDVKALIKTSKSYGVNMFVIESVDLVNEHQKAWFWEKISSYFDGDLEEKQISIWGGAFKPNTDDVRHSPSLYLIDKLLTRRAKIHLFDPAAMGKMTEIYGDKIVFFKNAYECLSDSHALIITTEWNEFRSPDFDKMQKVMQTPIIFDGRNLYDGQLLAEKGFKYFGIGISASK